MREAAESPRSRSPVKAVTTTASASASASASREGRGRGEAKTEGEGRGEGRRRADDGRRSSKDETAWWQKGRSEGWLSAVGRCKSG